ncbi:hypothetical protein [Nitrosomonas cryotolerans]|uniref:hypothetical protein n=1 Tax=Nitrosomonas cryotolerans TaxID=44575 RepID=UPI00049136DB|nr:hypothetical protein [Nitrosomonas cryotolerans]
MIVLRDSCQQDTIINNDEMREQCAIFQMCIKVGKNQAWIRYPDNLSLFDLFMGLEKWLSIQPVQYSLFKVIYDSGFLK